MVCLTKRAKLMEFFELKKVPGPGMCPVKGCRDRIGRKKCLCDYHHQARWRMKSPKKNAYALLRDSARKRGIAFKITFDYFTGLTDAHARYWTHEPDTRGDVLTIDRVDVTRGYEPGNLAIISLSENVIKGNKERHLPASIQAILDRRRARVTEPVVEEEDEERAPF